MHSIKRGSRSFARSIVSEKLLCRWVAPPAGRVAQIFIGTGARLGIREPSAKTPADMGYFAVQMWLTVRYLHRELRRERRLSKMVLTATKVIIVAAAVLLGVVIGGGLV